MNITGRIASLAAMGISSFLAPRLASALWKLVTGEEPPSEDEGGKFLQVIAFAGISAVLVSAIQFFTMKGADKVLPKGERRDADQLIAEEGEHSDASA